MCLTISCHGNTLVLIYLQISSNSTVRSNLVLILIYLQLFSSSTNLLIKFSTYTKPGKIVEKYLVRFSDIPN